MQVLKAELEARQNVVAWLGESGGVTKELIRK